MMAVHSKWATPPAVAGAVVDVLADTFRDFARCSFVEPAAGTGNFIDALARVCGYTNLTAIEIDTDLYGELRKWHGGGAMSIKNADYLTLPPNPWRKFVIGNPPFSDGIGLDFVERAKKDADRIAFLLPASMLEPCGNRGVFTRGLTRVFPAYIRKFVDISGGDQNESGKAPTFLFVWERKNGEWRDGDPVLDFRLSKLLKARRVAA